MAALGADYADKPVSVVAISSNDAVDDPCRQSRRAEATGRGVRGFRLPLPVSTKRRQVARAYKAACTPDFFSFRRRVESGRIAESLTRSRPGNGVEVTGEDLRAAIDAVLAGKAGNRKSAAFDWLQYQVEGGLIE